MLTCPVETELGHRTAGHVEPIPQPQSRGLVRQPRPAHVSPVLLRPRPLPLVSQRICPLVPAHKPAINQLVKGAACLPSLEVAGAYTNEYALTRIEEKPLAMSLRQHEQTLG